MPTERSGERLIGLFFLGCLLFSPLALTVFDAGPDVEVAGVPILMVYLFAAWGCLIAAMAVVAVTLDVEDGEEHPSPGPGPGSGSGAGPGGGPGGGRPHRESPDA